MKSVSRNPVVRSFMRIGAGPWLLLVVLCIGAASPAGAQHELNATETLHASKDPPRTLRYSQAGGLLAAAGDQMRVWDSSQGYAELSVFSVPSGEAPIVSIREDEEQIALVPRVPSSAPIIYLYSPAGSRQGQTDVGDLLETIETLRFDEEHLHVAGFQSDRIRTVTIGKRGTRKRGQFRLDDEGCTQRRPEALRPRTADRKTPILLIEANCGQLHGIVRKELVLSEPSNHQVIGTHEWAREVSPPSPVFTAHPREPWVAWGRGELQWFQVDRSPDEANPTEWEDVRRNYHGKEVDKYVSALRFGPKAELLFAGFTHGRIDIWDVGSGQKVASDYLFEGRPVTDIAVHPSGEEAAASAFKTENVRVFEVRKEGQGAQ